MTSRDFAYWLQGFFEISGCGHGIGGPGLSAEQAKMIQRHLALVFKHEIDPSYGDAPHNAALQQIHDGNTNSPLAQNPVTWARDQLIKC